MTEQELKEILDSYSCKWLGKANHKYKVFNLDLPNNKSLFDLLYEEGYWKFAPHRSKKLVYYHQICNYFARGKSLPAGEGDILVCHHISGNTADNSWNNLIYLTPYEHELVSKYQRRLGRLKVKKFYKLENNVSLAERSRFNRQGKLIRNWTKFILGVICLTVARSHQWVSYTIENLKKLPPIIDIVKYIERYLKKINWKGECYAGNSEEAMLANLEVN
jgi:hypothetical protein